MADFYELLEAAEESTGVVKPQVITPAIGVPVEKGPAHIAGALKNLAYESFYTPGAASGAIGGVLPDWLGGKILREGWKANKTLLKAAINESPDVQDWQKAVAEDKEPFWAKVIGSAGPTIGGMIVGGPGEVLKDVPGVSALRWANPVGKLLAGAMFFQLNKEEITEQAIAEGADPKVANEVGNVGGAINAGLDMAGMGFLFRMARAKPLLNYLTALGTKSVLARVGMAMGEGVIGESATEGTQGVVTYLGKEYAKGRTNGETKGQFLERMLLPEHTEAMGKEFAENAAVGGATALLFGAAGVAARPMLGKLTPKAPPGTEGEDTTKAPPTPAPSEWPGGVEGVSDILKTEGAPNITTPEGVQKGMAGLYKNPAYDEYVRKAEEAELEKQAAAKAKETIIDDPDFQSRAKEITHLRWEVQVSQSSWNKAIEDGRKPPDRLSAMLDRKTAKLAELEQKQGEAFTDWHTRIVGDMRAELETDRKVREALSRGSLPTPAMIEGAVEEDRPDVEFLQKQRDNLAYDKPPDDVTEYSTEKQQEIARQVKANIEDRKARGDLSDITPEIEQGIIEIPPEYTPRPGGGSFISTFGIPSWFKPKDVLLTQLRDMLVDEKQGEYKSFDEMLDDAKDKAYTEAIAQGWSEAQAERIKRVSPKSLAQPRKAFSAGFQQARFAMPTEEAGVEPAPAGEAPAVENLKSGETVGTLRYDGPQEGVGHAWTETGTKRSFTTGEKTGAAVADRMKSMEIGETSDIGQLTDRLPEGKSLKDFEVDVKAIREKTGEEVVVKENAETALKEIEAKKNELEELLGCINRRRGRRLS